MQGNVLSPILCNVYLNKLDGYVKNEIINKYQKGKAPKINPEYIKQIGLKKEEKNLPEHLKKKIRKSRRRHTEKLGIKRLIENEDYVRIKYVRYANNFIIGVRGSIEVAKEIKTIVTN